MVGNSRRPNVMRKITMTDEIKATLVSSMNEEQLRAEVLRLSRALSEADRSRDDRSGMPMIGGADVCTTCSAHCNVMDEDQAEIARLNRIIERVANLAGCKWPTDRLTYPDSEIGKYAATAVRLCEDELREALHG